jgi:hypothetical protein
MPARTDDNNITVRLRNCRLSFPVLFTPKADEKGKLKYSAAFLFEKNSDAGRKNIQAIKDAIQQHIKNKNKGTQLPSGKICLREGSEKDFDGYGENVMFTSASTKNRPLVVDLQGNDIAETDAKAPYAGCYVNANIDVWFQNDKDYGKRVNASLRSVQFLRDGEPFGSAAKDAKQEFGDVSEDAGEDLG